MHNKATINYLVRFLTECQLKRIKEDTIEALIKSVPLSNLAKHYSTKECRIADELWNILCLAATLSPYQGLLSWTYLHKQLSAMIASASLSHDVLFMLTKFHTYRNVVFTLHNEKNALIIDSTILINIASTHILPDGTVGISGTDISTFLETTRVLNRQPLITG